MFTDRQALVHKVLAKTFNLGIVDDLAWGLTSIHLLEIVPLPGKQACGTNMKRWKSSNCLPRRRVGHGVGIRRVASRFRGDLDRAFGVIHPGALSPVFNHRAAT